MLADTTQCFQAIHTSKLRSRHKVIVYPIEVSRCFRVSDKMAQKYIKRITLFKMPDPEHVKKALEQYKILAANAVKVSSDKPA